MAIWHSAKSWLSLSIFFLSNSSNVQYFRSDRIPRECKSSLSAETLVHKDICTVTGELTIPYCCHFSNNSEYVEGNAVEAHKLTRNSKAGRRDWCTHAECVSARVLSRGISAFPVEMNREPAKCPVRCCWNRWGLQPLPFSSQRALTSYFPMQL